jgi:PAS domain S-box-containing protein
MAEGLAARHRLLVVVLWVNVPVVALLGLVMGEPIAVVGATSLILTGFAVAAMLLPGPVPSAAANSAGLAAAACVLVGFSGGLEALHLYFAVVIVAVAFYRDSRPLFVAVGLIAAYHFAVGIWFPGSEGATWAALHTGLLTVLALTLVLGWRLTEDAEVTLSMTTDRYRTSFVAAPIGMAVVKLSGEFLEVNESLAAMLGHPTDHFPGRNVRAVIHGDDMTLLGDAWEEMGNSKSHTASQWMRCITSEGGSVWSRVTVALVPRTAEQSAMVIIQVEDASTSRHELNKLEDLLWGKDMFVATVGHEIREPLAVMIDLTDDDDPRMRQINVQAREIASVVDDLVVSARATASPVDVVPTDFDLAAICRDILGRLPGGENVPIDARASLAWADPELAAQIITGMMGNSIRYGGPKVRVQIFNSGPDTVVQVVDDGPEIPAQQRERIFNGDLSQGRPATRPAAVGLSLTVGRHLARRMEGDIGYRRSGDGLNIFELRLPSEELTRTYTPRARPRLGKTDALA